METSSVYEGGFSNPAHQSANAFKAIMQVMARPGTIEPIDGASAPAPVSPAAATAIITLCDPETGIFLAPSHDNEEVRNWITFHCNAPLVDAESADFALGTWRSLQPSERFKVGVPEYPDRAATLIVEMEQLTQSGVVLTGPGIETIAALNLPELTAFQANAKQFPLGFDCLFTAGTSIAALPRSTKIREAS